jgi:hypothetical protein
MISPISYESVLISAIRGVFDNSAISRQGLSGWPAGIKISMSAFSRS